MSNGCEGIEGGVIDGVFKNTKPCMNCIYSKFRDCLTMRSIRITNSEACAKRVEILSENLIRAIIHWTAVSSINADIHDIRSK